MIELINFFLIQLCCVENVHTCLYVVTVYCYSDCQYVVHHTVDLLTSPHQVKVGNAEAGYVHLTVWKKLDQTYELTSIELNKTAEDLL